MRARLLAALSAALLCSLGAAPVSANGSHDDEDSYLALGDSVSFGTSPLVSPANAGNFVGYPEIVARALELTDVNASCPGEATGGFLSLTGTDNVCRDYRFRYSFPLHVSYTGTQVAFALGYLRAHKKGTRLVTLTLGANDFFRYQKDCLLGATVGTCPLGVAGVLGVMYANLNSILSQIRATGYHGLIVAVTYYALDYNNIAGTLGLNSPMIAAAQANDALVASGFTAFQATATAAGGSSCTAGLLIHVSASTCDVHPSPRGRDLLAAAVLDTIAASCPEHVAQDCLDLERD